MAKDQNRQFRCLGMWILHRRLSVVVHNTQACMRSTKSTSCCGN